MTVARRVAGAAALDELAGVVGEPAALALARAFGGTEVYVPRVVGDAHPVCIAIGRDAADRLAAWAGGGALAIPKQVERRARVLELNARSLTRAEIARQTGFSERHVYRLLAEEEAHGQPDLFAAE